MLLLKSLLHILLLLISLGGVCMVLYYVVKFLSYMNKKVEKTEEVVQVIKESAKEVSEGVKETAESVISFATSKFKSIIKSAEEYISGLGEEHTEDDSPSNPNINPQNSNNGNPNSVPIKVEVQVVTKKSSNGLFNLVALTSLFSNKMFTISLSLFLAFIGWFIYTMHSFKFEFKCLLYRYMSQTDAVLKSSIMELAKHMRTIQTEIGGGGSGGVVACQVVWIS